MGYDFDRVIERRGSLCIKYDFAKERGREEDVLPLWVADMDFQTAPEVLERLHGAVAQTGYSQVNLMGLAATQAAYETGEEWLAELKGYLGGNLEFVRTFLGERLPEIKLTEPEGKALNESISPARKVR